MGNIFHNVLLPAFRFHVKTGARSLLRDKGLFELSKVEITKVDCISNFSFILHPAVHMLAHTISHYYTHHITLPYRAEGRTLFTHVCNSNNTDISLQFDWLIG